MLIGELVKRTGLSKETIRYYESLGLLVSKPRLAGTRTYRDYTEDSVERIDIILRGKAMGFSLREGKPLLDLFMDNKMTPKMNLQAVEKKISEIDQKISNLRSIKKRLAQKRKDLLESISTH